ncbi:MAG TPA: FmdB family zinc ribbon protein [Burkholderiales bacterium]|jgi:putative FmdB family regulatory protein|nr:FmdB family zinc ribbon protein [Burkholderiales bacterium]
MPIYAYRCEDCGHPQDFLQKMSDPLIDTCPSCGSKNFKKQLTAAGFQLKGGGWYVTDFRDSGKKDGKKAAGEAAPATGVAAPATGDSGAKSESGAAKSDAAASTPAPAASSSGSSASSGGGSGSASSPPAAPSGGAKSA